MAAGAQKQEEAGMQLDRNFDLRQLSVHEFAALGLEEVAFVKPKQQDGEWVFAIHTADGREVAVVADRDVAFFTVRENDMEPMSVH